MLKRSPLRRVSKKRKQGYIEYAKVRRKYLENHQICQCCDHQLSTEIHHKRNRGIYLCAVEYFCAVCRDCHNWIHANPEKAFDKNLIIKRL